MDLSKQKSIRAGHKSVLKRFLRKAEEAMEKQELSRKQLQSLLESLEERQSTLKKLDEDILCVTEEMDMEAEIVETAEYNYTINTNINEFRHFINETHPLPVTQEFNYTQQSFSAPNVPSQHMYPSLSSMSSQNQHLPKLTLPKFSGDLLNWQTFWDSFESSVHNNITLTDIQKFNYLKSLVTDEAAKTIAGFPMTNANYTEAIKILKARFGQTHKIIDAYMQAMLQLRAPSNTLTSIRDYYDTIETYIRGLEALGQSGDSFGTLLIPVILNKLPDDFRINLTRDNGSDKWKLNTLRESILKEIQILESGRRKKFDNYESEATASFFTKAHSKDKPYVKVRQENSIKSSQIRDKPCVFCYEKHDPAKCTQVPDYSHRMNIVRHKQLCFNCLGSHRSNECRSSFRCKNCHKKHHTSLCQPTENRNDNVKSVATQNASVNVVDTSQNTCTSINTSTVSTGPNVLLKTAITPVWMYNRVTQANILFDEGAQRSFITETLAHELNLDLERAETEVIYLAVFGSTENKVRHLPKCTVYIEAIDKRRIPVDVLVVPEIANPIYNQGNIDTRKYRYLNGLRLAHSVTTDSRFEISMLIGADFYWKIVQDRVIRGNGPTAVKSKVGYLLSGPLNEQVEKAAVSMNNILVGHKAEEFDLQRFWKLESLGINETEHETELTDYLETYQKTSIEMSEGRYIARLPWKPEHEELPSNLSVAKRRTESVINRLRKTPELLKLYGKIIEEQEQRGFIEKVSDETEAERIHYIPHHPVTKDSSTTPIRIVYDCSCKQSPQHVSLNDCLMNTPPALNDLSEILIRFRMNPVAIVTDIEKAFLHVGLHEQDRDATRFLWLENPQDPDSDFIAYRFKSVLFGATSSPFILCAVLLKHLHDNDGEISRMLERDLYVDNVLSSVRSETEAINFYREARALMTKAGFNLRAWNSNSQHVRDLAKSEGVLDTDKFTKVLGLRWNVDSDELMYVERTILPNDSAKITKREILKQASKVYDPLGWLSPVTVRAKILMQQLWKNQYDWDKVLPTEICNAWKDIATDVTEATKLKMHRCYLSQHDSERLHLHVFVDASMKAYGATAYITDYQESALVMAKTRVAPVKELTLPQLELMAAVIGARLTNHLQAIINCSKVTLWSDSQIVLQWISTTKPLKRFIANRVKEIRDATEGYEWRYCPTDSNPADLLTRGISSRALTESKLWLQGPNWLTNIDVYPSKSFANHSILVLFSDDETHTQSPDDVGHDVGISKVINCQNYSTYGRLLRVTAYVLRFVNNCRSPTSSKVIGPLKRNEIKAVSTIWIRECQATSYTEEYSALQTGTEKTKKSSRIRQLRLFLDEDNMIRCGGRIQNAPLAVNTKFPYLLPTNHHLTDMIVLETHRLLLHSGANFTITQLRQTFWIPSIRQLVRKLLNKCVTCKRVTGRPYIAPDPPPLPKIRVQDAPPFTVTGIDFTGALTVKDRNGTSEKCYICLFTCAATRAIHLELVKDLSEETFLHAFRRFTSRKSLPQIVVTDNACSFIAASREIKEIVNSERIKEDFTARGIEWRFIPKRAPWFGGWWERLIALTKTSLKKILGQSLIDFDALHTILTEIERVLNDRPLTYVATDIGETEPLTPAHLLYGRRISSMPYPHVDIDTSNFQIGDSEIRKRAERQSELIQHFVKQWKTEYLTQLREYHTKSGHMDNRIRVGDIVQVHDEKPRYMWKTAIVKEVVKGNDGLIRSAIIRTANGCTSRPIVKLYPLEVCVESNQQPDETKKRFVPERAKENIKKWTH